MTNGDIVIINEDPINYTEIVQSVQRNSAGGIGVFIGTTRDTFEGKRVKELSYESYKPLAIKSLKEIIQKAKDSYFGIHAVAIHHRIGIVPVGESSVAIAVSAVHRKEAILSTEYIIDELKKKTPIWKKEIYEDGCSTWKENCGCLLSK